MDQVLETNRLLLRRIRPTDGSFLCTILQNREVMYAWDHAFSDQEVADWIQENLMRYDRDGYSYWTVVEKASNSPVGVCGLIAEQADQESYVGIGYIFQKRVWGQGYAFESATACVEYAAYVLHCKEVTAQIRPDNIPSRRVAEKLGMVVRKAFIRIDGGKAVPHLLYGRTL